jgi:integrase
VIIINYIKNINQKQLIEIYQSLPADTRIIWRIGIETGLRISDILHIRVAAVTNPMQIYESRTKRIKICSMSAELYDELIKHIQGREASAWVFPSKRKDGRHLHRTTFHRQLKKIANVSSMCTRRWFLAPDC